jgi:hypothetical protein
VELRPRKAQPRLELRLATKNCPHCGEEVPLEATRCKSCFQELAPPAKGVSKPLIAAVIVVLMLVGAAGVFFIANRRAVTQNVVVDKETQSIIISKKSGDGTDTRRIRFADVDKVELVVGGTTAVWAVYLLDPKDSRTLLHSSSDEDLTEYAQHVAAVMDKPLILDQKVSGMDQSLPAAGDADAATGADKDAGKSRKSPGR